MMRVERLRQMQVQGPLVRIRGLGEADLPHTLAWRNDDRSLKWFKNPARLQPESHLNWFRGYQASDTAGCMFFVETLDGNPVGQSSIYNVDGDTAEVGRFLSRPELRGTGLFREALLLTLFAAFDLAQLQRVHLEVIQDNERAIRLYASVGFVAGEIGDGLLKMTLDASDFAALQAVQSLDITTMGSM